MIGTQVVDTDGVIDAIVGDRFDLSGYDALHRTAARTDARRRERPLRRPLPRRPAGRLGGEVIHFRPMSATSEVPAAFRHAAGDRGALRLIREGIATSGSRRRLVRYLVQADIRKRGADTLLGNIWWVLDPLLQMVVYVVFVTIIVPRPARPTTRSSSSPRSCPGSGSPRRSPTPTSSIVAQDQLIKQIQFPKIVLPTAAVGRRRRQLRVRARSRSGC